MYLSFMLPTTGTHTTFNARSADALAERLKPDGTRIGSLSTPPQAHPVTIVNRDVTLADVTAKFNILLASSEGTAYLRHRSHP